MKLRAALGASALAFAVTACGGRSQSTTAGPAVVPVVTATGALLAAGYQHSLAPGANGQILSWGGNASGELGDGSTEQRDTPVVIHGLTGQGTISGVAAGVTHSMAVTSSGTVLAWGHNASGELGSAISADQLSPEIVSGVTNGRAVAAGDGWSMALEADGTVLAWGNNESGELGDGNAPTDHATPAPVYGLTSGSGVVQIAAGYSFGLVLKTDQSVWAWGNGTSGELGDGSLDKRSAPTPVTGLGAGSGVVQVAGGATFSLALKSDGTVLAWGNNESGELGDGKAPVDSAVPVQVKGLGPGSGVVAIAAGGTSALALKSDGTVLAWGNNESGELGDGNAPKDSAVPVRVRGLRQADRVVAIAVGGSHCVALTKSGQILAWGSDGVGQLGDGATLPTRSIPVIALGKSGGTT